MALWEVEFPFTTITYASMLIDAAGEKAAYIVAAPKAGTIDRVCFRTVAVTTSDTLDVRVESLDANGDPSGTLLGANSNGSQAGLAANTWYEVTLTTPVAVSRGDRFAVVIVQGAVGNLAIARLSSGFAGAPYSDLYTGSWAKSSNASIGAVRYNDGSYAQIGGLMPFDTQANSNYNSGSTPDEKGNKITIPFACKVSGAWMLGSAQSGDFTILLRDSGGTLLASKAIDGDAHQGSSAVYERYPLDTEVTLAAGDVVRLTKRPDSASNTSVCEFTCPSGLSAALPGGGAMVYTSRTDAGAWTDTADKVAAIGLILSALSDNTGGARPRARGWVG
jgi:hypothetical protein